MTRSPIIGITLAGLRSPGGEPNSGTPTPGPLFAGVREGYIWGLLRAGAIPVAIPYGGAEKDRELFLSHCDGIVFSGGEDLGPSITGKAPHPTSHDINPQRDEWESALFDDAIEQGVRGILGVCRGAELIAVKLGATLHPHIPDFSEQIHDSQKHGSERWFDILHELSLDEDSEMAQRSGVSTLQMNSLHHQGILPPLPSPLREVSQTPDGIVELFEGRVGNTLLWGVQGHPEALIGEYLHSGDLEDSPGESCFRIFKAFVEECAK